MNGSIRVHHAAAVHYSYRTIRYRTLFPYKLDPMPKAYFNVKKPKFGPFLRASEAEKKKMSKTPSFLGQKLK